MYIENTNVSFSVPSIPDLELQINTDLWLKANKLSLKAAKTELMIISSRQKLLSLNDYAINNDIDSVQVNQTTQQISWA